MNAIIAALKALNSVSGSFLVVPVAPAGVGFIGWRRLLKA
jgi:hypothetical protein